MASSLEEMKQAVFEYVTVRLGDGIVDVEVDPIHLETAYARAIGTYRQRAHGATEESYVFMELKEDKNEYTLPDEVTHVRQVFRRSMTTVNGAHSTAFDPFSSATLNVYLLNFNYSGGLATYELYSQYQEQAARMFGGYMNFTFNPSTKKLTLVRNPKGDGETVLLWTYNLKPEVQLLTDLRISQWIKDFTYSATKQIVGEAREKFGSINGPQGGVSLNGSALKSEAKDEINDLIEQLKNLVDGSDGYSFIIG